jgi:outer membrane protein
MAPLRRRLSDAIMAVGQARGYAFILNTDNNAVPFVNGALG